MGPVAEVTLAFADPPHPLCVGPALTPAEAGHATHISAPHVTRKPAKPFKGRCPRCFPTPHPLCVGLALLLHGPWQHMHRVDGVRADARQQLQQDLGIVINEAAARRQSILEATGERAQHFFPVQHQTRSKFHQMQCSPKGNSPEAKTAAQQAQV